MKHAYRQIGIIGAGAMGRGIAQIAAQAGAVVALFDQDASVAQTAVQQVRAQWERLVAKERLQRDQADVCLQNLRSVPALSDLADCDLLIEAIVEDLPSKVRLLQALEAVVRPEAHLASNTSSLSITAIAASLRLPARFAGLHFFNPVPLMKVVEVVAGLHTHAAVTEALAQLVRHMGHTPVQAQDTPGFIVNHAGRGYGTEALRLVSEQVTDFQTVDRVLRDQIGFKLGPFELMDLTGLDVSHPVMESIYHQYFEEPRYRPSVITAQRLAGGMTGRKVGAGFYRYEDGVAQATQEPAAPSVDAMPPIWVSPRATRRQELLQLLKKVEARVETGATPSPQALILVAPLGFDVTTVVAVDQLDATRTLGIDMLVAPARTGRYLLASNPATRPDMRVAAQALFARDGKPVSVVRDSAGFIAQRVVAHIINIACDMCQQGICSPTDLEQAVTLGLGYPQGPLAMGDGFGPASILEILFNMHTVYADPRYRPSVWLRRRAALGLSLSHTGD